MTTSIRDAFTRCVNEVLTGPCDGMVPWTRGRKHLAGVAGVAIAKQIDTSNWNVSIGAKGMVNEKDRERLIFDLGFGLRLGCQGLVSWDRSDWHNTDSNRVRDILLAQLLDAGFMFSAGQPLAVAPSHLSVVNGWLHKKPTR